MLVFLLFKESESDYKLTIETKELEISENLLKKVEMVCKFACVKSSITNGNIKNIKGTNIAYVKSGSYIGELQDKYWQRMNNNGFNLESGIKNSDNEHISIKEFKKITRKLDNRMEKQNYLMTRDYEELEEKLQKSKPTITKKEVKIDKETYDTLKKFMNTSKMVIRDMPKNEALYQELKHYTDNLKEMEMENRHLKYEISRLEEKNEELQKEYLCYGNNCV